MNSSLPPLELIITRCDTVSSPDMDDSLGLHSCCSSSTTTQPLVESRWEGSNSQLQVSLDINSNKAGTDNDTDNDAMLKVVPKQGDVALRCPRRQATIDSQDAAEFKNKKLLPQRERSRRFSLREGRLHTPTQPIRRSRTESDRPNNIISSNSNNKSLRIPRRLRRSMPGSLGSSTTGANDISTTTKGEQHHSASRPKRYSDSAVVVLDETINSLQKLVPYDDDDDDQQVRTVIAACDSTRTQRVDNCCQRQSSNNSLEVDDAEKKKPDVGVPTVTVGKDKGAFDNAAGSSLKDHLRVKNATNHVLSMTTDDEDTSLSSSLKGLQEASGQLLSGGGDGSSSSLLLGTLILKAMEDDLNTSTSCRIASTSITATPNQDGRPRLPGRNASREIIDPRV